MPLEVSINNTPAGNWVLLERDHVLHAPADAFEEWRVIRLRDAKGTQYRGQTWYPLTSVPGFEERRNFASQSVDLTFSPTAFAATLLSSKSAARPPLTATVPSVFLNYDLSATQAASRYSSTTTRDLGALTEIGFSSGIGVLTSSYIGRNLSDKDASTSGIWRRLETRFTRDFPANNLTLGLGDATTRSSMSGRSMYFGGVHISNNFALTPGFVSQPAPTIAGMSRAPSTVELYINNALRETANVPAGPFAIENFQALTGAGEARVVLRDLLGRETVVVQRFFTDPNLLQKGLSDWSVEAGAIRRKLSIDNANYGEGFASGVWRYGLNRTLTLEGQAQLSKSVQDAGLGMTFELPFQALGQMALAVSRDHDGERGYELLAGAEHNTLRHGFAVRAQSASRNYRQLGFEAGVRPQRLALSTTYSYASETLGSLSLGLARIASYDNASFTTYSANYSVRIGLRSALTFSATRVTGSASGNSFGLALMIPLDGHVNSSSSVRTRSKQTEAYSSINKGLTSEIGVGWRALAGTRDNEAYSEGGVYYQGSKMLLTADVSAASSQRAARVGAQGGLVLMDGRVFAARRLDDSFALVEVPGYSDVGVGFQGSTLTRTDKNGVALLPRLLPYQSNSIRLDPAELPISAELDSIEQIAVPAARSGVKVTFPVRSGRGALIKVVLDNGEPAPAGAAIELVGDKQEFFVARRGEAFVTGLQTNNLLRLKAAGLSCSFKVELPPGSLDDIARMGPVICSSSQNTEKR